MQEQARQTLIEMGFDAGIAAQAAAGCANEEDAVRRALALTGQEGGHSDRGGTQRLGEMKMVFVAREELGLSAAQLAECVAHAVEDCVMDCRERQPAQLTHYLSGATPKIVLRCSGGKTLASLFLQARQAGLPVGLVILPSVEGRQPAVLGIGPAEISQIDAITGCLRLF